jgi:hypothetical protein
MIVRNGSLTFTANQAMDPYLRVKLTAGKLVPAGAADEDIGTLESRVLAANDPAAVVPRNVHGTIKMVAAGTIAQFATVYAAAAGKIADSGAIIRGLALQAASGNGSIIEVLPMSDAILGTVARANLQEDALQSYPIVLINLRVHDAIQTNLVTTASSDDLAVIGGTFGTDAVKVQSSDAKATSVTQYARFQVAVPPEYVAGGDAKLRINAGMITTVSDTSATIDVEAFRQAAPTADICATAAQSINSLTAANKDFALTATNLVPGDILDVRVKVAIADSATATAVIGQLNKIELLLDIKG